MTKADKSNKLNRKFANVKNNKAIDIYNSKYDQTAVEFRWHLSPTEAGLAIAF